MFVDDIVLYLKGNLENFMRIMIIFNRYCEVLGVKVNWYK